MRKPGSWTCLAAVLLLLPAVELHAQRNLRKAPKPDPAVELGQFQAAEGFEVNLFAANPLIAKPINMNFDARGRLWVASSGVYPHIKPGQVPNDRILILEDTDGDGAADRSTVFADGLLMPTGVIPDDNEGAYIANSTDLLYMRDHDGDRKADEKRVVLSGFGIEDTHHILHTFRYGPGGNLYFNQSIYIHSHIETPYGVRRMNGGGIWQFRPEKLRLEIYVHGMCNGWGHHFDRWGQSFGADGAYGDGVIYLMPGATIIGSPTSRKIMRGLNPGSPKECGAEILSGRHLPPEWRGTFVTNDFRAHRVRRYEISENGAGYASRQVAEPLRSKHIAFRPVDVKMGPDGAIYFADWYNPIIQHGEVDFRSPMRNHQHGRVWRLTAKGRALVEKPKLVGATEEKLLDYLKAPEDWTRHHAKRVLSHRSQEKVAKALGKWVAGLDRADPEYNHQLLEALWTYQTIDKVEAGLLGRLLRSPDHKVRAAATRVVGHWHDRLDNPLPLLGVQVADESPRVRLEAVRTLGFVGSRAGGSIAEVAMELAMTVLDHPVDASGGLPGHRGGRHFKDGGQASGFLAYALHVTAVDLEPWWLPALENGKVDFGGNSRQLEFALASVGTRRVVGRLVALIKDGKIPDDRQEGLLEMVALQGDSAQLAFAFERAGDSQRVLAALARSARERKVVPASGREKVAALVRSSDQPAQAAGARLAGLWKMMDLRPRLEEMATGGGDDSVRIAAFDGLANFSDNASVAFLKEQSASGESAKSRGMAVSALASIDPVTAASHAVELLGRKQGFDPRPVFSAFLSRQGGAAALSSALEAKKIDQDAARIGVRLTEPRRPPGDTAGPESQLIQALRKAAGLSGGPRKLAAKEVARLSREVVERGDPARGEALYHSGALACLKCHAIGGAGGLVGPDLSSIGTTAQLDYLIDSIFDPNKAIKENYHSTTAVTKDGRVLTGIKLRETASELILRDSEGRELPVRRDNIARQSMGGSLMPSGLTDSLTSDELRDLLRFLSEIGKIGNYSVGKTPFARRWRVLEKVPPGLGPAGEISPVAGPDDSNLQWVSSYSRVSGVLPLSQLQLDRVSPVSFAWCELRVVAAGKIGIKPNSGQGLTIYLGGKKVFPGDESSPVVSLDLPVGVYPLLFRVESKSRKIGLSCELVEIEGAKGRAQFVLGR